MPINPLPVFLNDCDCGNVADVQSPDDVCRCQDCHDSRYTDCADCGEATDNDDLHYDDESERYLCESCYDELFTTCDDCNGTIRCDDDDNGTNAAGNTICSSCRDNYTCCDDCGDTVSTDDTVCTDDGCYCTSCAPSSDGEDISARRFRPSENTYNRISGRRFGIELETSNCDGYSDADGEFYFSSCDDGSIDAKEFVSEILSGDAGLDGVEDFCNYASRNGWAVDAGCGYHLHIDVTDCDDSQLLSVCSAYHATQNLWALFVPSGRRRNSYCKALSWSMSDCVDRTEDDGFESFARHIDRYQWFNIAAYSEHTTFEIRLHSASLDADKVCNWIIAHVKFTDWAKHRSRDEIADYFSGDVKAQFAAWSAIVGNDISAFYAARAAKFGTILVESSAAGSSADMSAASAAA